MKKMSMHICLAAIYASSAIAAQQTPLIDAVKANNLERVKELVASGKANFNERERYEDPNLFTAVENAHYYYLSPLEIAVTQESFPIAEILVKAGADINVNGGVLLLNAVIKDNMPVTEFLIRAGANINAADERGMTLLMKIIDLHPSQTPTKSVKPFLNAKPNLNLKDGQGRTALMYAAVGMLPFIEMLLQAGADATLRDKEGKTALDYAEEARFYDVVEAARIGSSVAYKTVDNPQKQAIAKELLTKAMQKTKAMKAMQKKK